MGFLDLTGLTTFWNNVRDYIDDHKATVTQTLTSGTEIGSVDGTKLYAPSGGSGGGNVVGIGSRNNESHALYATAGNGISIDNAPQAQTNVVIRNTPATETALGGVIIGDGLSVTSAGKISVTGGGGQSTWYGTSNTAAGTAAKVVSCTGFTLATGTIIGVLFTTANTAATPTLNVNSTGAKTIYIGGSTINATTNVLKWSANTMLFFIYDGTYYRYLGSMAGATLNQPDGAGTWYGTSSTGATTAAKTTTIANFRLTPGAIVAVTFSTANTYITNALTLNVNGTGAKTIYVNNAATSSSNTLTWAAKETLLFVYSGSYWYFITKSGGTGGGSSYTLPPATASTLGGIKVGSGLSVASDGTLSTTGGGGGADTWLDASDLLDTSGAGDADGSGYFKLYVNAGIGMASLVWNYTVAASTPMPSIQITDNVFIPSGESWFFDDVVVVQNTPMPCGGVIGYDPNNDNVLVQFGLYRGVTASNIRYGNVTWPLESFTVTT